ncbi:MULTISPECIES: hypothetical protein [unclassified Streptomyces]|uniref:hypothetical protein n=1 Tax=unclassified Streptomyces TaxID=2593676 RepID=UPI002DD85375|nr:MULTISPECIES: hypothetical protein [unclassified Streptomyces]WSA95994.1 hypothetical protein OIE63_33890 [Streptomyces sp. NBC_01795]WSB80410.1 hypothetical protein OHB04_35000 [Streptomyces sp. NBC_01775]WSS11385.1 hypothetical protein OG533_05260 [Streptomyces sp. NBC_01186]WSS40091.1 hypothetical protein OG220_05355 [Streptomyces sp. NBC_01187]
MPSTLFDLDVELVESVEGQVAHPDAARELDENAALTPTTINTYGIGVAMCVPCC